MQRRNVIKQMTLLMGTALSAPTLLAFQKLGTAPPREGGFVLQENQKAVLAEVAEMIIPKTKTAGAIEAGVPEFIELMLRDCYPKTENENVIKGLDDLLTIGFLKMNQAQKIMVLTDLEAKTTEEMKRRNVRQTKIGDNEDQELIDKKPKGTPFWRLMKELTLLGYFTSEKGITENFDYQPIPGKLELIKIKPGQKAFAY